MQPFPPKAVVFGTAMRRFESSHPSQSSSHDSALTQCFTAETSENWLDRARPGPTGLDAYSAMIDALCEGSLADPMTPGLAIEVLKSGKKRWRYRRQVARQKVVATIFGGLSPAQSMAEAHEWARELNTQTEAELTRALSSAPRKPDKEHRPD